METRAARGSRRRDRRSGSSGDTLRANRLRAVEEIRPISARLIVNQAALKLSATPSTAPRPVHEGSGKNA